MRNRLSQISSAAALYVLLGMVLKHRKRVYLEASPITHLKIAVKEVFDDPRALAQHIVWQIERG